MTALGRRRVTIVAIIVSLVIVLMTLLNMSQRQIRAEVERGARVRTDIRALATQLSEYGRRHGAYPTTDQGLNMLGVAPRDPWLSAYVYRCPGIHNRAGYDLFSPGPDRKANTPDDDWGDQ